MLRKEFEIWSINPIIKETLVKPDLHISILSYLKKTLFYFIKLLNCDIKENRQIIELDITNAIPDNN